jgi:chromosome segregation ATPase
LPLTDDISAFIGSTNGQAVPAEPKPALKSADKKPDAKGSQSSDLRKRIAELKQAHRQETQALKSKHQSEQKLLREELKDQQRKARAALEESKKHYDSQLRQMRADYAAQSESLRGELKQYLEEAVKEIATNYESRMKNESDDKIEGLRSMIHDDFLKALQEKEYELDQLRRESSDEAARIIQENNEKNHRIAQLESKMKEVSRHLPEDVQEDLAEQFGFEAELDSLEESKPNRKGLLARITSLF